jgi:hypothetical protein
MAQPSFSAGTKLDELMAQLGALRQQTGVQAMPTGAAPPLPQQQPPQQPPSSGYDMQRAREMLMPTPRSETEIQALRGADAYQANQIGKQMYDANNPKGRGILGMIQHGIRSFDRDEETQGYTDQAMTSLEKARAAELERERRLAQDKINEMLQAQGVDLYKLDRTEAGADTRNIRTTDTSILTNAATNATSRLNNADTIASQQTARDDEQRAKQFGAPTTYHDGAGGVVNVYNDPDTGQTFTIAPDGGKEFIDTRGLTPYSSGTNSSTPLRSELAAKEDAREQRQLANRDAYQGSRLSRIMNYDNLVGVTGRFDPNRIISNVQPLNDQQAQDQSIGITMKAAQTEALAPILSIMGVNPTDRDMELALSTVPSPNSQPMAWFDYVENEFAPAARDTAFRMIREGNSDLTYDDVLDIYEGMVNDARSNRQRIYGGDEDMGDFDPTQPLTDPNAATQEQRDARIKFLQGQM